METIKVQVGGKEFDLDAVVNLMDADLREMLHGYHYNSEQEFVDAYAEHHMAKFGAEFIVN